jgi:hypothetical protein
MVPEDSGVFRWNSSPAMIFVSEQAAAFSSYTPLYLRTYRRSAALSALMNVDLQGCLTQSQSLHETKLLPSIHRSGRHERSMTSMIFSAATENS